MPAKKYFTEEERKLAISISAKKSYQKHRISRIKRSVEGSREYKKEYKIKNREKIRQTERIRIARTRDRYNEVHMQAYHRLKLADPEKFQTQTNARSLQRTLNQHKISPEEYVLLVESQDNCCAICGNPPGNRRLHIDHNHQTGKNRSLLCTHCNRGLGGFNDEIDLLEIAIEYLKSHEDMENKNESV